MAPERSQPLSAEHLLKARLRAAIGDADLLTPAARQQVLVALVALTEAIALVTAKEH